LTQLWSVPMSVDARIRSCTENSSPFFRAIEFSDRRSKLWSIAFIPAILDLDHHPIDRTTIRISCYTNSLEMNKIWRDNIQNFKFINYPLGVMWIAAMQWRDPSAPPSPSSVITKVPLPWIGDSGMKSLRHKKRRPLAKATATRRKVGRWIRRRTAAVLGASGSKA